MVATMTLTNSTCSARGGSITVTLNGGASPYKYQFYIIFYYFLLLMLYSNNILQLYGVPRSNKVIWILHKSLHCQHACSYLQRFRSLLRVRKIITKETKRE